MKDALEKKLIIFDMDGTVIDSEQDVFLCFSHVLRTKLNIELTREKFKELAGMTLDDSYRQVLPADKKYLAEELTAAYRKRYIDEGHCLDTTVLFDDVRETLKILKDQGFILAVASSKHERALKPIIEKLDLAETFDLIVGSGVKNLKHKPDPEVLNYILETLNIVKEDAVMVGDTRIDIEAGKNANIDTIALTYGYEVQGKLIECKPTYLIDNFKEIINLLKFKG